MIAGADSFSVELLGSEAAAVHLPEAEHYVDNPYSGLAYTRAFRPEIVPQLQHVFVRSAHRPQAAMSFLAQGSTLAVINRLLEPSGAVLGECIARMFDANPAAQRIVIEGMYADESPTPTANGRFPRRVWRATEDFELALPASFDEYMNVFGAKTRKNLRYCERRFEREQPSADLLVLEGDAIDAATVDAIIRLNHLRMESKGRASGIDAQYARKLLMLCRACGVACVARNGDEVLGGTLCTRVGQGWSLHVIAHDPRFNHVRLGLICLLRTLDAAIAAGAKKFHFLWGDSPYKTLFGARMRPLWTHCYYRSSLSRLLAIQDVTARVRLELRRQLIALRRRAASPATPEPA